MANAFVDKQKGLSPKNALGPIALFVGIVELAFAYPVTSFPLKKAHPLADYAYSDKELRLIRDFVGAGRGLLLMSNHDSLTQHDSELALQFVVEIENTRFLNPEGGCSVLSGELLCEHPIISGASDGERVYTIVANNCCSIVTKSGCPIVLLSS
jgi:hypothetical protein